MVTIAKRAAVLILIVLCIIVGVLAVIAVTRHNEAAPAPAVNDAETVHINDDGTIYIQEIVDYIYAECGPKDEDSSNWDNCVAMKKISINREYIQPYQIVNDDGVPINSSRTYSIIRYRL